MRVGKLPIERGSNESYGEIRRGHEARGRYKTGEIDVSLNLPKRVILYCENVDFDCNHRGLSKKELRLTTVHSDAITQGRALRDSSFSRFDARKTFSITHAKEMNEEHNA